MTVVFTPIDNCNSLDFRSLGFQCDIRYDKLFSLHDSSVPISYTLETLKEINILKTEIRRLIVLRKKILKSEGINLDYIYPV